MAKPIPHEFMLEQLEPMDPYTKHMFGALGVYIENKIVFILREKAGSEADNGVWVATYGEHHASLRKEMPSLRSIEIFGPGETAWQVLPSSGERFEEEASHAVQLVLQGDIRIGRIPKSKAAGRPKKKKPSPRRSRRS